MSEATLAIHAGAGPMDRSRRNASDDRDARDALVRSLEAGRSVLRGGGPAVTAVEIAVRVLEDFPDFNAGLGSVLTATGIPEMDAAIATSDGRRAGAVAAISGIANPVSLARAVMDDGRSLLLAGDGALQFARERGIAVIPAAELVTARRAAQLARAQGAGDMRLDHDETEREQAWADPDDGMGTVGAVARDAEGRLAAATSTGGMTNKQPGRVGDSPLLGSGTWADDACAVSGTGTGEAFIRAAFAHELAARVQLLGQSLDRAAREALEVVAALGGTGGVIAMPASGDPALIFTTTGMPRGVCEDRGGPRVALYSDEVL